LTPALCETLRAAGHPILLHDERADAARPPCDGVQRLPTVPLAQWLREDPLAESVRHVVFALPPPASPIAPDAAVSALAALADTLQTRIEDFLQQLQAATRLLCRHEGAQIWVLTPDESMRYHLGTAPGCIETQARHAAVKSVAKEVWRFGLRVNCACVQQLAEQSTPAQWSQARETLRAYAMRFRPNPAAAVARTLSAWIGEPELPMAGVVVPVGIGMVEGNL
jgi:hypothetical protein